MRPLIALVLLLATAFAGCSDAPAAEDDGITLGDGSKVDLDNSAKAGKGLGAIAGVVVDEAITPLLGAKVNVSQLGTTVETNEGGAFGISDLTPGLYTLSVSAVDHLTIQTTVDVIADDITKIRIVLPVDPSPKPYHSTLKFDWYDSVGQPLVDFAWDLFRPTGTPALCDVCAWTFETDGPVQTFVLEAHWDDSVAPPTGVSQFYWSLEPTADSSAYEDDYFASPGRVALGNNMWGGHTEFFLMMSYDETWIALEQSAEVFVTMFYLDEAPPEWSFIAGDV